MSEESTQSRRQIAKHREVRVIKQEKYCEASRQGWVCGQVIIEATNTSKARILNWNIRITYEVFFIYKHMPCAVPCGYKWGLYKVRSRSSFDATQGCSFWECTLEEMNAGAYWDRVLRAYCLLTQEVQMIDPNKISTVLNHQGSSLGSSPISSVWPPADKSIPGRLFIQFLDG